MLPFANKQHKNILLIMSSGQNSQKNIVLLEEIYKILLLCEYRYRIKPRRHTTSTYMYTLTPFTLEILYEI